MMDAWQLTVPLDPIAYVREGKGAADEWKAMRNPDGKPKLDMELSLDYASTWSRMEDLLSTGKVRYIGKHDDMNSSGLT
jgi:diketogulonate reductase-like aldo/keto reductase